MVSSFLHALLLGKHGDLLQIVQLACFLIGSIGHPIHILIVIVVLIVALRPPKKVHLGLGLMLYFRLMLE